nr:MAG TPA: hypothetical protein [Caudoviricetes sp.]
MQDSVNLLNIMHKAVTPLRVLLRQDIPQNMLIPMLQNYYKILQSQIISKSFPISSKMSAL